MRKRQLKTRASLANGNELNSLFVPFYILSPGCIEWFYVEVAEGNWIDGRVALPFVNLGVAVGKGKPSGAVVISGGNVFPLVGVRIGDKEGVVDSVRMLVQREVGHARLRHVRRFEELAIVRAKPADAAAVSFVSAVRETKKGVHRNAAEPLLPALRPLRRAEEAIGGAFVDADGAVRVRTQNAVLHPSDVGNASRAHCVVGLPSHEIVDPVVKPSRSDGVFGSGNGKVVGASFVVVAGVKYPAEDELFVVADAADGFGFFFGLAEGRQQHAGQNSDDGNDNEKFDERKTGPACGLRLAAEFFYDCFHDVKLF